MSFKKTAKVAQCVKTSIRQMVLKEESSGISAVIVNMIFHLFEDLDR